VQESDQGQTGGKESASAGGSGAAEEENASKAQEAPTGGPKEAAPPLQAGPGETAESQPSEEPEQALIARPEEQDRPLGLPAPVGALRAESPLSRKVDRHETMPGDIVKRPLTLPRGTMELSFSQGIVFIDGSDSGNAPGFALGITDALEIGLTGPLYFDLAAQNWAALQPTPHVAFTWWDTDLMEAGARADLRISTQEETESALLLSAPVLFRPHESWRIDAALEGDIGFEKQTQVTLRIPVLARVQFSRAFFGGLGAAAEIGLTSQRASDADAQVLLGTTFQNNGRAYMDFSVAFFLENIGAGSGSQLTDGGGVSISLSFFPELY
jgi:hypothetical protein